MLMSKWLYRRVHLKTINPLLSLDKNHFAHVMRRDRRERSFLENASEQGTEHDRVRPYAYRTLSILHKTYSCFFALLSIKVIITCVYESFICKHHE